MKKILLMLLPFWTPLNPPLGIASLKANLENKGFDVSTLDANVSDEFFDTFRKYYSILGSFIPDDKKGNFNNTTHLVLRNHLISHYNFYHTNHGYTKEDYEDLLSQIVYQHFFCSLSGGQINQLDDFIKEFYKDLRHFIENQIDRFNPDAVGLSVFTGTLAPSIFAFDVIKEKNPSIQTLMGGGVFADVLSVGSINFNHFTEKVKKVDIIILGEGEKLLYEVLAGNLSGQKVYTLKDLGDRVLDLKELEPPDFSDLNIQRYPQLAAFTSRSCPFQCSFCSETVQWGKYRMKASEQIVNEMQYLYDKYRIQLFLFGDSLLNSVCQDLSRELLQRNMNYYWDGYLRADKPVGDPENARLWRKGGMYRARLGVESGSQKILDLMHKHITPDQIRDALRALASNGIKTTTYWVIGHPGETEEDFGMTLDLIEEMKDDIYEAECNPFHFFYSGQVDSEVWNAENNIKPLFDPKYAELLLTQTWEMEAEPNREIIYDRVCRFVSHCKKLGIPNPYTLQEIYFADKRWKGLHEMAVPGIHEFKKLDRMIKEDIQ